MSQSQVAVLDAKTLIPKLEIGTLAEAQQVQRSPQIVVETDPKEGEINEYIEKDNPELNIYANEGKVSLLKLNDEYVGYMVLISKYLEAKQVLIVKLNMRKHPEINLEEVGRVIKSLALQYKVELDGKWPINTLLIDFAESDQISHRSSLDSEEIVKELAYICEEPGINDIVLINWDRSPKGKPIFILEFWGNIPNEVSLKMIYRGLKAKLKSMPFPGKVFDVVRLDRITLDGMTIVKTIYRYAQVFLHDMPDEKYGGGAVIVHKGPATILNNFFSKGLRDLSSYGHTSYPFWITDNPRLCYPFIDDLSKQ